MSVNGLLNQAARQVIAASLPSLKPKDMRGRGVDHKMSSIVDDEISSLV